MDSAELTGWAAWERYKAARSQETAPQRTQQALMGGL